MNNHFLLIGAMKAGTSSLHHDLSLLEGVYMTPEKEPNDLMSESVTSLQGKEHYLSKFCGAAAGDICGDASTGYSKMPTYAGVPQRATQILGDTLKIIYLTREPIDRIVSQYQHLHALGFEKRPLNQAVLEDPTYVSYSAYQYQLRFWLDALPQEQIMKVRFEDYIETPETVLKAIASFLDVAPPSSVSRTHRNPSTAKFYIPKGHTSSPTDVQSVHSIYGQTFTRAICDRHPAATISAKSSC